MFRGPGHRGPFAPGPYGSRVALPLDLRTLPFVFVRSHAWPKQSLPEFYFAVANRQAASIPRTTYFLPNDGYLHPAQAMCTGMTALSRAQNHLTALQQAAIFKHTKGMPLTAQEAREILTLPRSPQTVNWQANKRAAARAAGAPVLTARQLPPYVVNHMPPAVMKMRAALQQSGVGFMDESNIISRQRRAWDLMGEQVRGVLKGRV